MGRSLRRRVMPIRVPFESGLSASSLQFRQTRTKRDRGTDMANDYDIERLVERVKNLEQAFSEQEKMRLTGRVSNLEKVVNAQEIRYSIERISNLES